jgi:queuosine precursor transporter
MICFPLTFSICDIITEVYGEEAANKAIIAGLVSLFIYFITLYIVTHLSPAESWGNQTAWESIFSASYRIMIATFVAYYLGEKANSKLLSILKFMYNKQFFLRRSIASTFVGILIDTVVFNAIAFLGVFELSFWLKFTVSQLILKIFFEIFGSWVASGIVPFIKRHENLDPIQPRAWITNYLANYKN